MGGVPSVPSVPAEELQECAKAVFEVFVPIYTKAAGVALVAQMRKEKELRTNETDWPWLRVPPTPSEPLGQSIGEKLGAVRENWKKRTMVFMNEADQFEVRYYAEEEVDVTDEKAPAPKGAMKLCGYRAKRVKEELAEEKYGSKYALSVAPYWGSDRRRTWSVRFETEEELEKAETLFRTSIYNARAPVNPDPVLGAAFKAAYRATRWELGVWGWFSYYKSEEDMLANMVVDKAEREVMGPVYAKIPSGAAEGIVRRQVVKILDTTVGTAVAGLWKGALAGVNTAMPKIKETAESSLGPIIQLQLDIRAKISDAVGGIVGPVIATITQPVFGPLVQALGAPLGKAYATAITTVRGEIEKAAADADSAKKFERLMYELGRYWGPLRPAYDDIRGLTRPGENTGPGRGDQIMAAIMEIVVALNPSLTMWRLEWRLEREIKDLAIRMVYSYSSMVAEGATSDAATMDLVVAMAVHDANLAGANILNNILFDTVAPKMDQELRPLVAEPIAPLKEMIVAPLDVLVDLDDLLNSVLYDLINTVVDGVVSPAVNGAAFEPIRALAPAGITVSPAAIAAAREVFVAMEMERDIPTPAEAAKLAEEAGSAPEGGVAGASGGAASGEGAAPAPAAAVEKEEAAAPAPAATETEEAAAPAPAATETEEAAAPAPAATETEEAAAPAPAATETEEAAAPAPAAATETAAAPAEATPADAPEAPAATE